MTAPSPPTQPLSLDAANALLAAFDVADDPESWAFLADLLASGTAPPEEVELLSRGRDHTAKPAVRQQHARGRSRASSSPSPSPSPSKRRRRTKADRRGTDAVKKGRTARKQTSKHSSVGLKTTVSPFFEDSPTSTNDEGEDEETVSTTDAQTQEKTSVPALIPPWTGTLVITRKVVLGGRADVPPDLPPSPPKAVASRVATPSPEAEQCTLPTMRTPSPVKMIKEERWSLSPAAFSPIPSPTRGTPLSKRKRESTSYFFTPPSSRDTRQSEEDSDGDENADTDNDEKRSGNNTTPIAPVAATPTLPRRGTVSGLPFPPLGAPQFGLVQEQLANEPFWLLIALVFLTRVAGRVSLRVFWAIKARYPTPQALLDADPNDLVDAMRHLGMATVRCTAIKRYARGWLARPPQPGVCTTVKNYPLPPEGSNEAPVSSQWEIGHLTSGAYAVDSWRIFCRDALLGRSKDWKGDTGGDMAATRHSASQTESESESEPERETETETDAESVDRRDCRSARPADNAFQPEWMRVLPRDKELRACLRWMWMREGWDWDPRTGERTVLSAALRSAVDEGRVDYDVQGQLQILEGEGEPKRKEQVAVTI